MAERAYKANCQTCKHPDRPKIEMFLARGLSTRILAAKFPPLSHHSIQRHLKNHVGASLMARLRAQALSNVGQLDLAALRQSESESLLTNLMAVRASLSELAEAASASGDWRSAGLILSRLVAALKTEGELLGQFAHLASVTNNVLTISPDYLRLRSGLIRVLAPYPKARMAVASLLRELEASPTLDSDNETEVMGAIPAVSRDAASPSPDYAPSREAAIVAHAAAAGTRRESRNG